MQVSVKRNHEMYMDGMDDPKYAFTLMSVHIGKVKVSTHIHEDGKGDGSSVRYDKSDKVIVA
jgi:hypothetical protein